MHPQQLRSLNKNDDGHGKRDCNHFTEPFSPLLGPLDIPQVTWSYPPGSETVLLHVIWEQGRAAISTNLQSQPGWRASSTAAV